LKDQISKKANVKMELNGGQMMLRETGGSGRASERMVDENGG